jgi:hypothetical protein
MRPECDLNATPRQCIRLPTRTHAEGLIGQMARPYVTSESTAAASLYTASRDGWQEQGEFVYLGRIALALYLCMLAFLGECERRS